MSWTYSGDPSYSPKDEVRALIYDIDISNQLLSDEFINYAIARVYGSAPPASGNYLPAAYCADSIRARFAQNADSKTVGDLSISKQNQGQRFAELARQLRNQATLAGCRIYAGGQSLAEKQAIDADTDRIQTAVKIDGMDRNGPDNRNWNPGV